MTATGPAAANHDVDVRLFAGKAGTGLTSAVVVEVDTGCDAVEAATVDVPDAVAHVRMGPTGTMSAGDVLVSGNDGLVQWLTSDGAAVATIDTRISGEATGMATGPDGNVYLTHFQANRISVLAPDGTRLGDFGSGFNMNPESLAFDSGGNLYVGQADGNRDVLKFAPDGTLVTTYDVAVEDRGSDWITLAPDDCTLYYTSEGLRVLRYDICTDTQLPDFATLPNRPAFALHLFTDGRVLVATSSVIYLLADDGTVLQTYDTGSTYWFGLDVALDEESFWTGDFRSGRVYHFDIASGAVLDDFATPLSSAKGSHVYDVPSSP